MSKKPPATRPRGRALPDGKRKYGWIPDVPDHRDLTLATPRMRLPKSVDLRPNLPVPAYDQGQLGSCTANAAAAAVQYNQVEQGLPLLMPSRLFIYYTERVMEGTVGEDSGATIRDSIKALNKGWCPEDVWPYDVACFADKPTAAAYKAAKGHRCLKYQRVNQTAYAMKAALARGNPFMLGFSVYESFESATVARTGKVPMPRSTESMLGGHAVFCVGYTEDGEWICRNSWGQWGDHGHFYMPTDYLLNPELSDDFWAATFIK